MKIKFSIVAICLFCACLTVKAGFVDTSGLDTNAFVVNKSAGTVGPNTNAANPKALSTKGDLLAVQAIVNTHSNEWQNGSNNLNTAIGGKVSISSGLWRSQIWLDATNGNDSTALVNNPDKPWLSLSNACNWCATNPFTILHINPGFYDNGTNELPPMPNTVIVGASRLLCTLNVNGNLSPEPAFFRPADNFTLSEVKLLHTAANNNFFTLFGTDVGIDVGMSATNWRVVNVDMSGQADAVNFGAATETNSGRFVQCRLESSFDTLAGGTTNDTLYFDNCVLSPTITSAQKHRAVSLSGVNAHFRNCEFIIGNSSASGSVVINNGASYSTFDNCIFRDIGGFSGSHVGMLSASTGTIVVNNCESIGTTNDFDFVSGTPGVFNNYYRSDAQTLIGIGNYFGIVGSQGGFTVSSNLTVQGIVTTAGLNASGGFTNGQATANTLAIFDANKKETSLANGGANTVVHGTTPPTYSSIVEDDLGLTDVTTANASSSSHGFAPKLPNDATKYYDGTGVFSVPPGGGSSTTNYQNLNGTNLSYATATAFPGPKMLITVGDSNFRGTFVASNSIDYWLTNFYLPGVFVNATNIARSGDEIVAQTTAYNALPLVWRTNGDGTNRIFLVNIGLNDIKHGSNSVGTIGGWSNLVWQIAVRDGNSNGVVAFEITPEAWTDAQFTYLQSVDEFIDTNSFSAYVIPIRKVFNPINNFTLDNTHYTTNTHMFMAGMTAAALQTRGRQQTLPITGLNGRTLDLYSDTNVRSLAGWGNMLNVVGLFPGIRMSEQGLDSGSIAMYSGNFVIRVAPSTGNEAIAVTVAQTQAIFAGSVQSLNIFTTASTSNLISGNVRMETNAAPFTTVAASGLNTIALGKGWTNNFGRRADVIMNVTVTDAATGAPVIGFTNSITGESYTNSVNLGIAATPTYSIIYSDISPGDKGSLTDYSTGTGSSIVINSANWKLK